MDAALATRLPEPQRSEALRLALVAANEVSSVLLRAGARAAVAARLPERQRHVVVDSPLREVEGIDDLSVQLRAAAVLAVHLPEPARADTLGQLFEIVEQNSFPHSDTWVEQLPERYVPALDADDAVDYQLPTRGDLYRAELLCALAPHIRELSRSEAFTLAMEEAVTDAVEPERILFHRQAISARKANAPFPGLIAHLDPQHLRGALKTALELRHKDDGRSCRTVVARLGGCADSTPATEVVALLRMLFHVVPQRQLLHEALAAAVPAVERAAGRGAVERQYAVARRG